METVDLEANVLRVLKNEALRSIPAGVGMRDGRWMEVGEVEPEMPASVRRRLKVFDVNLLKASEKDDFR